MSKKEVILTPGSKSTNAPYSPGIRLDDFVFVSGQGPYNPETEKFETFDFDHQVALTIRNVERVLLAAGSSLDDVVKVTVHLQNINDFDRMNTVYRSLFRAPHPARTTVQSVLVAGISVEIDAIAVRGCGNKHAT
jgi:2-iminobutanoate/2-iminopropanoate deaminase